MVFFFQFIPFLFQLFVLSLDPGVEFLLLVPGNLGRNPVLFSLFFLLCDRDLELNFGGFLLFLHVFQ